MSGEFVWHIERRFLENKMLRKIFGVKVWREQDAKEK
jgi:hypothetical protein